MSDEPRSTAGRDVDVLASIDAIRRLKARYFYFLDTKQWDALRTVFWDDAVFDPGAEGAYSFEGVDGFIAGASRGLEHAVSVHHGHTPIIDVDGDAATGIWAMTDYVEIHDPSPDGRRGFVGYGHYHERYERRGDEWRMVSWKLTRLRVDPLT